MICRGTFPKSPFFNQLTENSLRIVASSSRDSAEEYSSREHTCSSLYLYFATLAMNAFTPISQSVLEHGKYMAILNLLTILS